MKTGKDPTHEEEENAFEPRAHEDYEFTCDAMRETGDGGVEISHAPWVPADQFSRLIAKSAGQAVEVRTIVYPRRLVVRVIQSSAQADHAPILKGAATREDMKRKSELLLMNAQEREPRTAEQLGVDASTRNFLASMNDAAAKGCTLHFKGADGVREQMELAGRDALSALPLEGKQPVAVDGFVTGSGTRDVGARLEIGRGTEFIGVPDMTLASAQEYESSGARISGMKTWTDDGPVLTAWTVVQQGKLDV